MFLDSPHPKVQGDRKALVASAEAKLLRDCIPSSIMVLLRVLSPREKEPKSARRGRHNSASAMPPPSGLSPVAADSWAHWWLWCLKRLAGAAFWIPLEGAAWQRAAGLSKGSVAMEIRAGALVEQRLGKSPRAGRRVRFPCKAKKQATLTYFACKNRAAERSSRPGQPTGTEGNLHMFRVTARLSRAVTPA